MEHFPTTFTLETVLGCNLRCPDCAVGGELISRPYGTMAMENYLTLAEKIRPYVKYLYLHLWGEPLLNTDIFSMVRHATEFTKTNISTNANLVTPEKAAQLIASGVSDIIVSIDGVSQKVYETYRRRGDVGKAVRGLAYLAEFNARNGGHARIIPQFIVFEHNLHEKDHFAALCSKLGLSASFKAPYLRADSELKATGLPGLTREIETDQDKRKEAMKACPNVRDVFTVHLDGRVVACCYDHDGATQFGNLYEQSVEEIWESPKYQAFRTDLMEGRPTDFCMNECLMY